jgi:hypothetical protein
MYVPNKGYILVPDRTCFACGTTKTYRDKRNIRHWRINRDDNGNELQALCMNCWSRYIQNPITHAKHNKMRIHYKGKDICLSFNPRKGICTKCGKEGKTQLHHEEYDDNDVLAHTVELCVSCHSKRSIELGQYAEPFLRKKKEKDVRY